MIAACVSWGYYTVFLIFLQGGFAKCYELTDMDTKEIFAGKIVAKSLLQKPHQKEKVYGLQTFEKVCKNISYFNYTHLFFKWEIRS